MEKEEEKEKDLYSIYHHLIDYYLESGIINQIDTFSHFAQENPGLEFLTETTTQGLCSMSKKIVLINDREPIQEQLYTLFHEVGHLLSGSDEAAADQTAILLCQTIEAVTGISIRAA